MLDVAFSDLREELVRRLMVGTRIDPAAYALIQLDGGRVLLVPRSVPDVQRATLLDYAGLQSGKERVARFVLAAALRSPAVRYLSQPRVGDAGTGDLWPALCEAAGTSVAWCAGVLRPPGPHWTPILHLFDVRARRVGVAKIAFTDITRANVLREADALGAVGGLHRGLMVPRLQGVAEAGSALVVVMDPLPAAVRSMRPDRVVPTQVIADLVDASGGPRPSGRTSRYLEALGRYVGEHPGLADGDRLICADLLAQPLPLARCHGDLVPWNAGHIGPDVVLWDFEYSYPDAPFGFDAVQSRYRLARELGTPVAPALRSAACGADQALGGLGLDSCQRRAVGALHAIDAARRIDHGVDANGTSRHESRLAIDVAIGLARGRG